MAILPTAVQQILQPYFAQPLGILGLLGLVPLIILYLVQPRPEKRLMPSMMFFMKKKKSGTVDRALRMLRSNLLLLFHILLILGLTAALAQPIMDIGQGPEKAVVILDTSASMADNIEQAREFVQDNLGEENTLIIADNTVQVPLEQASADQVMQAIRGTGTADTRTDIASAIDLASDYPGEIVLASDLDQTATQQSVEDMIQAHQQDNRAVHIMETEETNRWGITDVQPGTDNTTLEIKNFMQQPADIQLEGDASRQLGIPPQSIRLVELALEPGKNEIRLPDDDMPADNTAYVSIPPGRNLDIALISERRDPYFEKAVELIAFTDLVYRDPPLDTIPQADIYVIQQSNDLLRSTARELEEKARQGAGLIVFGHEGNFDKFETLPVERTSGKKDALVEISDPRRIYVGEASIYSLEKTAGETWASNNTVVRAGTGKGSVLFYGLEESDFQFDLLYPIFWKYAFKQLTDLPEVHDLHLQTGERLSAETIETPTGTEQGSVELKTAGFYNTSQGLYAVNLVSEDESYAEPVEIDEAESAEGASKQPIQHYAAVLLAVLVFLELAYIYYEGIL